MKISVVRSIICQHLCYKVETLGFPVKIDQFLGKKKKTVALDLHISNAGQSYAADEHSNHVQSVDHGSFPFIIADQIELKKKSIEINNQH